MSVGAAAKEAAAATKLEAGTVAAVIMFGTSDPKVLTAAERTTGVSGIVNLGRAATAACNFALAATSMHLSSNADAVRPEVGGRCAQLGTATGYEEIEPTGGPGDEELGVLEED